MHQECLVGPELRFKAGAYLCEAGNSHSRPAHTFFFSPQQASLFI